MPHWTDSPYELYTSSTDPDTDIIEALDGPLDNFFLTSNTSRHALETPNKAWYTAEHTRRTKGLDMSYHNFVPQAVYDRGLPRSWGPWAQWMLVDTSRLRPELEDELAETIGTTDRDKIIARQWGDDDPCKLTVFLSDFDRLHDPRAHVNDTVILGYLKHLERSHAGVYVLEPLRLAEAIKDWPNTETWGKLLAEIAPKSRILESRMIFLPWNSPRTIAGIPGHWSLMVLEPNKKQYRLLDSAGDCQKPPRALKTWVNSTVSSWAEKSSGNHETAEPGKDEDATMADASKTGANGKMEEWTWVPSQAVQQSDNAACGVYVCAHACVLASGTSNALEAKIPYGRGAATVLRRHISSVLLWYGSARPRSIV